MVVKNKGKKKNKQNSKEKTDKNEFAIKKRKPRCPCLICDEKHFTRDCPH